MFLISGFIVAHYHDGKTFRSNLFSCRQYSSFVVNAFFILQPIRPARCYLNINPLLEYILEKKAVWTGDMFLRNMRQETPRSTVSLRCTE